MHFQFSIFYFTGLVCHKLSIELDKIVKVHEKNVSEIVKDLYEVTSEFLASGEVKGTIDLHNY